MRKLLTLTAAVALAAGAVTHAQQTTPQAPPAQTKPDETAKPEDKDKAAKTAASIAGKWNMAVDMQGNVMNSPLELKLDGKKISGTVTGPQGESTPIQGEFADGKLTFSISVNGQNGPLQIAFNGALKDNGTLAGTMDFGAAAQGMVINWTAERVKEK